MNSINSKATATKPEVVFMKAGKLLIKGRSIPMDVKEFYQPLIDWANHLEIARLIVDIELEYMNSASAKKLLSLLKVLDNNNHVGKLTIRWHYEEGDEENLLSAQVFEKILTKANFKYSLHKEIS
jgi:hypothetical protein